MVGLFSSQRGMVYKSRDSRYELTTCSTSARPSQHVSASAVILTQRARSETSNSTRNLEKSYWVSWKPAIPKIFTARIRILIAIRVNDTTRARSRYLSVSNAPTSRSDVQGWIWNVIPPRAYRGKNLGVNVHRLTFKSPAKSSTISWVSRLGSPGAPTYS